MVGTPIDDIVTAETAAAYARVGKIAKDGTNCPCDRSSTIDPARVGIRRDSRLANTIYVNDNRHKSIYFKALGDIEMDHEHSRDGPAECKLCEQRRTAGDFGQGSREQSFRGLATASNSNVRRTAGG